MHRLMPGKASVSSSTLLQPLEVQRLKEAVLGLYLVLDPDFTIAAASDAYLRATMTTRDAIVGRSVFDVFPGNPADMTATGVHNLRVSLERVVLHRVADAMPVQKYDICRPDSEGSSVEERYWGLVNTPVFGTHHEVVYIIHQVEDVTAFMRLTQEGIEHEHVTQQLRAHGARMEAEIFKRAQGIQAVNQQLRAAKAALEAQVRERTAALAHANDALCAEMHRTKRLEEQSRQTHKMEAIGTLAGGIAHDFNNLLTVIAGYSSLVLSKLHADDPTRPYIEHIQQAGDRAASLTQQLLAFSRQQVLTPQVLDLNAILHDTTTMLGRLIGEDITLTTVLAPRLGRVKADPGQVEQILMNLAVNARDAMPQGGTLTIETANVALEASSTQTHLEVQSGPYVMLAMSDTGCGMDDATKAHLFEPFFTTKGLGQGTGLGLATIFGIVKQSGGHIWVYSELGHGSTFKIYLPVIEESVFAGTAPGSDPAPTGTEVILVVEDDDAVRASTVCALQRFGYTVLQARQGRDALQLCDTHPGPIHMLLSDVVMPEMGGRQVAEAILALHPHIKVLYVSGYTDDAVVRHGILHEHVAFLQKPFTPDALARKVREILRE